MKLTNKEIEYILTVIKTADLLDIESVIIEPGKVRGMGESQNVILFQNENVPQMQFGSIGLNKLSKLTSRIQLATSQNNLNIEAIVTDGDSSIGFDKYDISSKSTPPSYVKSLDIIGTNLNIQYRCPNPQTIRAPKNSTGIHEYKIAINPNVITMMQKGKSAMESKLVSIKGNKKGAFIEISDVGNDTLSYKFSDNFAILNNGNETFNFSYDLDLLLDLFKTNPLGEFYLTAKGSLIFEINNLNACVISKG